MCIQALEPISLAQEKLLFKDIFIMMVGLDNQCFLSPEPKKKNLSSLPSSVSILSAQYNSQRVAGV